jgi:hypothetical protein
MLATALAALAAEPRVMGAAAHRALRLPARLSILAAALLTSDRIVWLCERECSFWACAGGQRVII